MTWCNRKGQSTGEYAILFAIVLGAIIAVQSAIRNRIAQRLITEANNQGWSSAATLTTSSASLQDQTAAMTGPSTGTVGSASKGQSYQDANAVK